MSKFLQWELINAGKKKFERMDLELMYQSISCSISGNRNYTIRRNVIS